MANKLKRNSRNLSDKPSKSNPDKLKPEKEEKVNFKKLARDERTRKIVGFFFLLISIFLFISFISYFFTWRVDQDKVFKGTSFLFDDQVKVANLLGRLGAFISHFFIYKGFGIASLLICTFFFIVGINLLFSRKVFSIWRNLRYVTFGLLVLCVSLAFIFGKSNFPFGGGVGVMLSDWLVRFLGSIGTAALLLTIGISYIIWQFYNDFKHLLKKEKKFADENIPAGSSIAAGKEGMTSSDTKENYLKPGNGIPLTIKNEEFPGQVNEYKVFEKKDIDESGFQNVQPPVDKEIVKEIMHSHDLEEDEAENLELEIRTFEHGEKYENKKANEALPYEPTFELPNYKYPPLDLLEAHGSEKIVQDVRELENNKNQIVNTLKNYDIAIDTISATIGPTVTLYEIVPAPGVRISRIKNLEDDIALSLAALGIRIIAPIPGKGTIGIEVPNVKKSEVNMKTLLSSEKFQNNNFSLPIAIGKKIDNDNFIVDLASMPHLLMAGATGQGKSVGINAILVSLLYKKHPSQLKFVLIDPKKVELSLYSKIAKHFLAQLPEEADPIITDTKKVVHTLNALCLEMDDRYDLLKVAGARNIKEYNEKFIKRKLFQKGDKFLPFIVLVIDEFADLIMTAGKEIELPIARLAQLARAVGIHLVIATQRPSVNIITGTIKANFSSRIAFKVSSKIDSRTILDTGGAEQLIGKGDMLIAHHGEITRLQCAFVDTPEVEKVVEYIGRQEGFLQPFLLPEYVDERDFEDRNYDQNERDPLFEDAARLIVQNQVGSTSLLQRRMKLGYNRAGRLMDQLEAAGVVGPSQGSKSRDVLVKSETELKPLLGS